MDIDLSWQTIVLSQAIVSVAYIVFGIAGFGTALISVPLLAHIFPISVLIPTLAILDFLASATNVIKDRKKADYGELGFLIPFMVIGSIFGALILLKVKTPILLLLLGVFAVVYALYTLSGWKPIATLSRKWVVPTGLVGGVFSALFGSGGFIYAMYLSNRIYEKEGIRAAQSSIIGLSTLTRAILFLVAGVYLNSSILIYIALLVPAMAVGVTIGRRITLRMSREQFLTIVNVLLLASGSALIIRYITGS